MRLTSPCTPATRSSMARPMGIACPARRLCDLPARRELTMAWPVAMQGRVLPPGSDVGASRLMIPSPCCRHSDHVLLQKNQRKCHGTWRRLSDREFVARCLAGLKKCAKSTGRLAVASIWRRAYAYRHRHSGAVPHRASRHKPLSEREREKNRAKSQVRAKVEHALLVIKRIFGFAKVSYRRLKKNGNRLFVVAAPGQSRSHFRHSRQKSRLSPSSVATCSDRSHGKDMVPGTDVPGPPPGQAA